MFPPRYFPPNYFASSHFPPGHNNPPKDETPRTGLPSRETLHRDKAIPEAFIASRGLGGKNLATSGLGKGRLLTRVSEGLLCPGSKPTLARITLGKIRID